VHAVHRPERVVEELVFAAGWMTIIATKRH
jgi:hypothetical protein